MLTFSFKEYLRAKDADVDKLTTNRKEELLLEYLQNGGYPETITKKLDTKQYLDILFESILYKDIIKRYNIRKGKEVERLALYLLSNVATEFSYLSLASAVGMKSSMTSQKYSGFLEEAYLFFTINRFSYKTKRLGQGKKVYCYDSGFITAKAFQTRQNLGKFFENCVASHLKRKELDGQLELYYWKNRQNEEVDFVVKKGVKNVELIQVCYSAEDKKTADREIRALLKAGQELRCTNLTIVTMREDKTENKEWFNIKGRITYKPLWKWLLE